MTNKRILTLITLLLFLLLLVGCKARNQAPIITSIPITAVELGETYTYDVNATDPEGDTLAYSLITKPTGMTITSTTGLIKWTPKAEGNFTVAVKVSDGVLDIIQSFTIVVSKLSDPPAPPPVVNYAPIITSIPGDTATVGGKYIYDVNATDPEGDVLTYSLTKKPDDMTINSTTGLINWTPASKQIGDNPVIVKVSDGKKATTQNFTIVVSKPYTPPPPVNHAPVITSIPKTTAIVGENYIYNVIATDPDNDVLTYSLIDKPEGMVIVPSTGKVTWTPGFVGSYGGTVKVSDGKKSTTQSFTITVSEGEPDPEIELTGIVVDPKTMTLFVGESRTFKVTANYSDETTKNVTNDCVYVSNDTNIAKVLLVSPSNLQKSVLAVGEGTAKITVSYKGKTDTLIVKVNPAPLTSIVVEPETMDLLVGESKTIESVTAHYNDGSEAEIDFDECTYAFITATNIDIVTVEADTGLVTAVSEGSVYIVVSYTEGNITVKDGIAVAVSEPVQETITIRWLEDAVRYHNEGTLHSEWFNDPIPPIDDVTGKSLPPATLILTDDGYHFADIQEYFNDPDREYEGSVVIDETGLLSGWATYTLYGLPTKNDFVGQVEIIFDETINWSEVVPEKLPAEIPYDYDGIMVGTYTQLKWAYADNLVHQAILNKNYPKAVPAPEQGQFWWYVQYTDYTAHGGK